MEVIQYLNTKVSRCQMNHTEALQSLCMDVGVFARSCRDFQGLFRIDRANTASEKLKEVRNDCNLLVVRVEDGLFKLESTHSRHLSNFMTGPKRFDAHKHICRENVIGSKATVWFSEEYGWVANQLGVLTSLNKQKSELEMFFSVPRDRDLDLISKFFQDGSITGPETLGKSLCFTVSQKPQGGFNVYLTDVIDNVTGEYLEPYEVRDIAELVGCKYPRVYTFENNEELLRASQDYSKTMHGFVLLNAEGTPKGYVEGFSKNFW